MGPEDVCGDQFRTVGEGDLVGRAVFRDAAHCALRALLRHPASFSCGCHRPPTRFRGKGCAGDYSQPFSQRSAYRRSERVSGEASCHHHLPARRSPLRFVLGVLPKAARAHITPAADRGTTPHCKRLHSSSCISGGGWRRHMAQRAGCYHLLFGRVLRREGVDREPMHGLDVILDGCLDHAVPS